MVNQALFDSNDPIVIKWAVNNPFERKEQEMEMELNGQFEAFKETQEAMKNAAKKALKDIKKKLGGKRNRENENENFENNLMDDSKRVKRIEEETSGPVDNKVMADNISKLNTV
eukprot:CAMPEP_0205806712 /NCGR_PEP_ID=MMETSP0205-20121125/10347_1 /ASSEMBLY_ACC=CAM_ASM_000278 /TAXON_ID=36767 /ORGANISM="Euplotes focardii, Strain TN1" /LENGTH=113 /DNA_ID=CAMNT_0053080027 /DNA_START=385 /DNA_END=722 /DNA_ORIENTATION=-